jgi:2-polyprenyl-3-methyl-5-hydroxy-6-metoxy-1,4-benzoquinol methylase
MSGTEEHCDGSSASETIPRSRRAEFDAVATNYRQMVDESVGITGENSDYFAAYKANYVANHAAAGGASGKILDYGCGVGLLARQLKRHLPAMQVDGYDVSESSLERTDPSLRSQGIFTSRIEQLGRDYKIAILANVLHHVKPSDRPSVILKVTTHLSPGGRLVVFEHNPINPLTRWAVSHCPFDEGVVLPPSSEVRALCSTELQLERTDYIVFFPRWLAPLRPLERFLRWCPAGAQHATVALKTK